MNKNELALALGEKLSIKKSEAQKCWDGMIDILTEELHQTGKIVIPNLGIFAVVDRKARTGRNPKTGEVTLIPASKSIKFKSSKTLKNSVQ